MPIPAPTLLANVAASTGSTTTSRSTPFFGKRTRPWLDGYRAEARSTGAAKLAAVSQIADPTRRTAFGVLGGAAAQTLTVPSGFVSLTGAADLDATNVATLLSAILIRYAPGDRANAVVVTRAPTGGTLVAGQWRIIDGTTISVFTPGSADAFTIYELLVPPAASIYNPVAVAQNAAATTDANWTPFVANVPQVAVVADFMACDDTAAVQLSRIFR